MWESLKSSTVSYFGAQDCIQDLVYAKKHVFSQLLVAKSLAFKNTMAQVWHRTVYIA